MTIAAERFAVIAAITLPVTATSSVVGMNVIVNDQHVGCTASAAACRDGHDLHPDADLDQTARLVVRHRDPDEGPARPPRRVIILPSETRAEPDDPGG